MIEIKEMIDTEEREIEREEMEMLMVEEEMRGILVMPV